ncbi:hypothetical protein VSR01_17145 [Actinacidiphila sp. DG2A-62]|uniref:hypothetical protein n=1 Tax=Actinacidiphila sp. DG2A-62 TaxID=3108821 RepID=UPI002DB7DD9E|nr:hypothetical protein [Actinacidiphila sp. DG2A-62]MEC3995165.1 hypothetical protein [Actinacidiphila sp. DG2A-62]
MGCACGNKNKTTYKVTTPEGKVVYSSTSKPTAEAVAKRYKDSTVEEVLPGGKTAPATTSTKASVTS